MVSNDFATTNTSNNYTITTFSTAPQAHYFSTLDAAFVYVREYLEEHLGQKTEVSIELVTLDINGKEKQYYKAFCGYATQQIVNIPAPQTPYNPWTAPQWPQEDKWWTSPIIYCGPTPKVTLNEGAVGSDSAPRVKF